MDALGGKSGIMESRPRAEVLPEDVLSMYEISGQESITARAIERYFQNKRNYDEKIKTSAGEGVLGRDDFKLPIIRGPQVFHPLDFTQMSIADIWSMELPLNEKIVWVRHKIRRAPLEEKAHLLKTAKGILGNNLVEPLLYNHTDVSNKRSEEFVKSDSETILLGNELKGKTIIRRIFPSAFLAWQKAYEDYEMWRRAGFDYVPVEPIQSFKLDQDDMVEVASGVLDLDFDEWESIGGEFKKELKADENKILTILNKNNIFHRHQKMANFCLRFFRNENGQIDFNRKPRLYLIDFDLAFFREPGLIKPVIASTSLEVDSLKRENADPIIFRDGNDEIVVYTKRKDVLDVIYRRINWLEGSDVPDKYGYVHYIYTDFDEYYIEELLTSPPQSEAQDS